MKYEIGFIYKPVKVNGEELFVDKPYAIPVPINIIKAFRDNDIDLNTVENFPLIPPSFCS